MDPDAKNCLFCGLQFGLMKKRHYCMKCYKATCDGCSPAKVPLAGHPKPVKVCNDCLGLGGGGGGGGGGEQKSAAKGKAGKGDVAPRKVEMPPGGNFKTKYGVNDMILLDNLNNETILECLSSHYGGDEIYVYIGQVLISVNPFKMISGMYGGSTLNKYKGKSEHQNMPHVYAIAERTYRKMIQDLGRECVIITGESGAGKTEASKKIMEYIAAVSSKAKEVQRVKEQLLESNPFLEAFGNAKTLRNNNSSRFGKYMEIQFDVADPVGGRISVYLLEKNRVIERQQGERSFHIFYQMLSGASDTEKRDMGLGSPEQFEYLKSSGCYSVDNINDREEYKETRTAMDVIGLSADHQSQIFELLAAILQLGNLQFVKEGQGGSKVSNTNVLAVAAKLLGCSQQVVGEAVTHKLIKTGRETIDSPLVPQLASYARDSLAKGIYSRMFLWLVASANKSIHVQYFSNTIGVLDIYGFEIFGINSFEQLCINYVNEKLHQLFIELTLEGEQREYLDEGIAWVNIEYYNNKPICELVEARGQIFSLLDEESIFPQGTDRSFFEKLQRQLAANQNFVIVDARAGRFAVQHYAGEVTYSIDGFLDKNKDLLFPNLINLCVEANKSLLKELFQEDFATLQNSKARPKTSCMQFKEQVAALMDTLRHCRQHYIRCIKPNDQKRSNVFEKDMVMSQIQYLGLLENIKVRRAGYAYRVPFDEFLSKYKACSSRHIEFKEDAAQACEGLLKELDCRDYEMGKTKVFIRSPATLFKIEDMRSNFIAQAATMLPEGEQLIYADKVIAYAEGGSKQPQLLLMTGDHAYLFDLKAKPGQWSQQVTCEELQGILLADKKDGWMVLQCRECPPPNAKKQDNLRQWDVLILNVYKREILSVVEVLRGSGVTVDVRNSDVIPDSTNPQSPNYLFPPKNRGPGSRKGAKCSVM